MATVLMPLPACDFDPSEVAVSWRVLTDAGHEVVFATPSGQVGEADDLMVTGQGLDPWGFVPGVRRVVLGEDLLEVLGPGGVRVGHATDAIPGRRRALRYAPG